MKRLLAPVTARAHGRTLFGGEPVVFHCNFYNYWLQKTMLLDPDLKMAPVIQAAAEESAAQALVGAAKELRLETVDERRKLAESVFSELGFGTIRLGDVATDGGPVTLPTSHYGQCLRQATGAAFETAQSLFDAGFASAAAAFIHGHPQRSFRGVIDACQATGAPEGKISVVANEGDALLSGFQNEAHLDSVPGPPCSDTNIDESGIHAALATVDLSGNEEGLIPRFGVMLTRQFAGFYNRQSFEFLRAMADFGLLEAAETLLQDTGYRCAFHTFGGIMESPEWDAVVGPQCKSRADWVHGIVAVVNVLGWGTWRVMEVDEQHVVVRIFDDYEGSGWLDMYGRSERPVSFLAAAGVAGMMNLIYTADIHEKPTLDLAFYAHTFERDGLFEVSQRKSMAMGHTYTEIVASR